MPNSHSEQAYPHLPLLREERSAERRKKPSWGGNRPARGGRSVFSPKLESAVQRLITECQSRPAPFRGIQPHLVFRIPYAEGVSAEQLIEKLQQQTGLEIVSVEPDGAVVAFRTDVNLQEFNSAVDTYKNGPREGINPRTGKPYASTVADFLECIEPEGMRLWSKKDRIGTRLQEVIGLSGDSIAMTERYVVEVELWHPGGADRANSFLDEVKSLVDTDRREGERVLDTFKGEFIILVKIAVLGDKLKRLIEMDVVAEADLPPRPDFDPLQASDVTARDFPTPPRPPQDGPRLCVIDSGITSNHPLLANNVGHEEAILTQDPSPADAHGHGTMVAGLAVFGDVRACYEARNFTSPITLFSARVLNDRNEFDEEKLIINQMREAIEAFVQPPYNCRVFNISIGSGMPVIDSPRPRQALWAEELDILARKLKVVLIVSAGNHKEAEAVNATDAETVLQSYPGLLFNAQTGICDPASSAIAVTVGALAQHNIPAQVRGVSANDIIRPLAAVDEPAPMTRIGPGINGAIKPELVHYGGNLVFRGFGSVIRRVGYEPGTAAMSFSHQPTQELFSYDCGTSFAAPRIAHLAALVEHRLRTDLNEVPSSNLIRAVLAGTAEIPEAAVTRLTNSNGDHAPIKVCGYGFPSESDALRSRDRRVTMVYQGSIKIDHFDVFAVPIPDEFRYARGIRKIIVSLAYDPPVRRRRLDYLGVEMDIFLIRGKAIDEIHEAFRKLQPNEDAEEAITGAARMDLKPTASSRNGGYSRKKSTLQRCECVMKRPERSDVDYGNEYHLVVRCERKWAPTEIETQDFALSVTLCADDPDLYNQVALRIRQRVRARRST
ncbi:MAG: S8 family peptidase [Planctomycetes bacterium]|nr:S8 family peptidase [Planctomycetota bacterium]